MAAAVPTKVFVGNLSFKTRNPELTQAFQAVGKVVTANIITRGPRSLGYGFVEFESEADANNCIGKLNKTELDGRQINVEIARPRAATTNADGTAAAPAPRRARQPRKPRAPANDAATPTGEGAVQGEAGAKRRVRRPRAPRAAAADGTAAPATNAAAGTAGTAAPTDARVPSRRGRGGRGGRGGNRRFNTRRAPADGAAPATNAAPADAAAAPARTKRTRRPKSDEPRVPSTTTLFVANLHYQIDNAGLAEVFKAHNPIKAYVVQTHSGRSRGFGFVEFANQADQEAALKAIDKSVVQERPLSVKISLVRVPSATEGESATPAAAAAN